MNARSLPIILLFALGLGRVHAQEASVGCEQAYGVAKELYDAGRLFESLRRLDSLVPECREDKDQQQRILFLKAVIEAQNDSVKAMRRSMEQLFRNDRRYVLKPYDPLIVQLPAKTEIFDTYERLLGSRSVGPGLLRKDHGQWRAGISFAAQRALLDLGPARPVFEGDQLPTYDGGYGWEAGLNMEWDVRPNLAVRGAITWSVLDLDASSPSVSYKERVSTVPVVIGLKKMFWLGGLPWVPYVVAEGTYAPVVAVDAEIARSGDGLRFLAPKSLDRKGQREGEQIYAGGALGLGRKLGNVVIYFEVRYRHALKGLTKEDTDYAESGLLTNYYWLDRSTTMHSAGLVLGAQYVLRYHRNNRIYP